MAFSIGRSRLCAAKPVLGNWRYGLFTTIVPFNARLLFPGLFLGLDNQLIDYTTNPRDRVDRIND